ncbi:hypothetical protein PHET_10592 [Paragonimus heterotremus]|uniref:Uncharacterized protein n=1 Tax=Paragonimus heterotremus TaxID=100268 RepID=A0A8J4WTL9_9TREM|nr:hypothetical protein PHET_10592 [Paragonimus heterotremus]
MSGLKVAPCSVVDATVSRPLLLRSSSSKALLCSCGLTLHGQLPIEIVPYSLFTRNPDKVYSFVHQLTEAVISQTHFSHKFGTSQSSDADSTCPNGGDWWTTLVVNDHLTDFAHIWSTLLRYEELFNTSKLSDRSTLQQLITLCPSASDRTCDKSSCPCNGLQLRLGTVSTGFCPGPLSFWAPCSQVFAFQLVMAWAKLSMEDQEKACSLRTTNRPDSNLCRASYGVLENWVDLLTLGRLSALATNSVQIEPEAPSFLEEVGFGWRN